MPQRMRENYLLRSIKIAKKSTSGNVAVAIRGIKLSATLKKVGGAKNAEKKN